MISNFKNLYLIFFLVISFAGTSFLLQSISKAAPTENTLVYLPIVAKPLCNFPPLGPNDFQEYEPNDSYAQAIGPVLPWKTIWGCFSNVSDDDDMYFFRLLESSNITITLTNIPLGHDYTLAVYNELGTRLAYSANGENSDEQITLTTQPGGLYYIQVYNFSQTQSLQTYKLTAEYDVPLQCDVSYIVEELFPQLKDQPGRFPFYAVNSAFQCQIAFDTVRSELFALQMQYTGSIEDGYWGIATPNGYDASQFGGICFWAYAQQTPQSFTLNLKDTTGTEKPSSVQNISNANVWKSFCIPLSKYQGIETKQLNSFNIHFTQATGNNALWVDDFEFSIPCDHPAITEEISPQLKDESGQFPFYSKNPPAFHCQIMYDMVHSGLFSLWVEYSAGSEEGYWGIATPNGYDASQYNDICYWAYAQQIPQSFTINLKDTSGTEKQSSIQNILVADTWIKKCIPLSQYGGVQLGQLENVNIHFIQATGNATIRVDDFEFR